MTENIKCAECGKPAAVVVWGCCEYNRVPMCKGCGLMAMAHDKGRASRRCEPTEWEPLEEYIARSGYGFR